MRTPFVDISSLPPNLGQTCGYNKALPTKLLDWNGRPYCRGVTLSRPLDESATKAFGTLQAIANGVVSKHEIIVGARRPLRPRDENAGKNAAPLDLCRLRDIY